MPDKKVRIWATIRPVSEDAERPKLWAKFRATLEHISEKFYQSGITTESLIDNASTAISGAAQAKAAEVAKSFTEAEKNQVEICNLLRNSDSEARKKAAEAMKAEEEAFITNVQRVDAQLELMKKLNEMGVAFSIDIEGRLIIGRICDATGTEPPKIRGIRVKLVGPPPEELQWEGPHSESEDS